MSVTPENAARIARARVILADYASRHEGCRYDDADATMFAADLLTDLFHLADALGETPETITDRAHLYFREERAENEEDHQ